MKILVVFIDMTRVDHLSLYNNKWDDTPIDSLFKDIGGVLFNKCYSPSPDTPRSLACMQTGLYPYYNGCDTRIKWPKFFIKEDITTIWDNAIELGYNVNLCCNKHEVDTGFFKYQTTKNIYLCYDPTSFVNNSVISENSLSFIGIPDIHEAVNDWGGTDGAIRKGFDIVGNYFSKFLTRQYLEQFDYVFFFSDHGLAMESERIKNKSSLDLLNDGRNNLLMFCHKKGDTSVQIDNRLSVIMDLYATIENLIGGKDYRHGYSLLEEKKRQILHIEDHSDFGVRPDIMIALWRVISDNMDIRTDTRTTINKDGTPADAALIESHLHEYSPMYEYLKKCNGILDFYKEINEHQPTYFEGSRRLNRYISFMIKAYYKIRRDILKNFMYNKWLQKGLIVYE